MKRYASALQKEIRLAGRRWRDAKVSTVYLGGGTPSFFPPRLFGETLDALRSSFSIEKDAEFTSEANPGVLSEEWLDVARRGGVNRLSLGVQATQLRLLQTLGRVHSPQDVGAAFRAARAAGFSRLSADLMFALPGQSVDDYLESVRETAALSPEHISAYSLIVEEGTPLACLAASGALTVPDEDEAAEFYERGLQELARLGYRQYEISNFSRPGRECRHNIGYWQGAYYLGLGAAACGMLPPGEEEAASGAPYVRTSNLSQRDAYCRAMEEQGSAVETRRPIPFREAMFEAVMLGLRMKRGVDGDDFRRRFGRSLRESYGAVLDRAAQNGLGEWTETDGYRLTARGLLLENAVLVELMDFPFSSAED